MSESFLKHRTFPFSLLFRHFHHVAIAYYWYYYGCCYYRSQFDGLFPYFLSLDTTVRRLYLLLETLSSFPVRRVESVPVIIINRRSRRINVCMFDGAGNNEMMQLLIELLSIRNERLLYVDDDNNIHTI